ncbi:MAG: hypothetical protein WA579_03550 [Rhodomicrobium sp.]
MQLISKDIFKAPFKAPGELIQDHLVYRLNAEGWRRGTREC